MYTIAKNTTFFSGKGHSALEAKKRIMKIHGLTLDATNKQILEAVSREHMETMNQKNQDLMQSASGYGVFIFYGLPKESMDVLAFMFDMHRLQDTVAYYFNAEYLDTGIERDVPVMTLIGKGYLRDYPGLGVASHEFDNQETPDIIESYGN